MDKISVARIALLHPKIKDEVLFLFEQAQKRIPNAIIRVTRTLSSFEEQNKLYAQGRTIKGLPIVTHARGGESYHNYGLALDFCLIKEGKSIFDPVVDFDKDGISDWMEFVLIFKQAGYEWGGDWRFKDLPHFQKTFGYSTRQLLQISKNKIYPNL